MKWFSHEIVTFSVVLAVTGNPVLAGLSALGSIIPDVIEPWKLHRTYGHVFYVWLFLFFLFSYFLYRKVGVLAGSPLDYFRVCFWLYFFEPQGRGAVSYINEFFSFVRFIWDLAEIEPFSGAFYVLSGFALGAFFHVVEDAFTVYGVPLLPVMGNLKISVKGINARGLFKTGSREEYIFVLVIFIVCMLIFGIRFF